MQLTAKSETGFLRHTLATLAYRGGKTIRNVPEDFSSFKIHLSAKPSIAILAHINDLLDWTLCLFNGESVWNNSTPDTWQAEAKRFHYTLQKIDDFIAEGNEIKCSPEKVFQGPIADALTHVGQIAYLRRLAGIPVMGENYFQADISVGCVGADQPAPKFEFN